MESIKDGSLKILSFLYDNYILDKKLDLKQLRIKFNNYGNNQFKLMIEHLIYFNYINDINYLLPKGIDYCEDKLK